jgi:enoyl reductase
VSMAVAFSSYGGPEVLEAIEVKIPPPAAGQIIVRVESAGVQPFDVRVRRGDLRRWVPVSFPQVLGNEFAGVIEEVGREAGAFEVGDEVIGFTTMRAYAEFAVAGVDGIVPKPPSMPWEEAGVLSAAGQTAHIALSELKVGEGDTVLVHAAAGGVGTFAVQLAREWGATVIGTASERNHDYLRHLGAYPVAYGPGLEERVRKLAPHGVDAALDAIGGEAIPVSLELVGNKDRVGTIADHAGAAKYGVSTLGGVRTAGRLKELVDLYERGRLRVHIQNAHPLRNAPRAHREVESGHVRGKVVLVAG